MNLCEPLTRKPHSISLQAVCSFTIFFLSTMVNFCTLYYFVVILFFPLFFSETTFFAQKSLRQTQSFWSNLEFDVSCFFFIKSLLRTNYTIDCCTNIGANNNSSGSKNQLFFRVRKIYIKRNKRLVVIAWDFVWLAFGI